MAISKKTGLGRGLESLFGDVEINPSRDETESREADKSAKTKGKTSSKGKSDSAAEDEKEGVKYIDINAIAPNPDQPRKTFNEEKIEELADSIKSHGMIQPIVVRKADAGYEIVAGERRYRAARKAGLKSVPCIVRELTDEQNMLLSIIENVQREDLNPIEEADSISKLINAYGLTQEQVSKSIGKSRPYITNSLRLLKLPDTIKEMVEQGNLSQGHARTLISISDEKRQMNLAKRAVEEGLSVRAMEKLAGEASPTTKRERRKVKKKSADQERVEEDLKKIMGTRVNICQQGSKGKIEIEYFSKDELERLIELLKTIG